MSDTPKFSPAKKIFSVLFLILGLALLVWTVRRVGFSDIVFMFSLLKGPGMAVLFFYPVVSFWDAWGWLYAFSAPARSKARVRDLFLVRLAGEAMNNLTPFADWGGEPLKIRLLCKKFNMTSIEAASGVILAKSVLFYSEVVFWIIGLVSAFTLQALSDDWKRVLAGVFAGCVVLSVVLMAFQMKGLFRSFGNIMGRFIPQLLHDRGTPFNVIDGLMSDFYALPQKGFLPSFTLHLIGWFFGGIETYLMLACMGAGIGFWESMAFEALLQLTRTATFFVPASLGVQEAGMAVYFSAFGHEAHLGVALSLLKRVRQLLWNAVGLCVWGVYELKRPSQHA